MSCTNILIKTSRVGGSVNCVPSKLFYHGTERYKKSFKDKSHLDEKYRKLSTAQSLFKLD